MADSRLSLALNLIKEKVPLSRIVSQDLPLHKKGREFVGNCPFHNEKTGSFFVNDDKGTFYCFGCGACGDIYEYLMKKRGIQFMQAAENLAEIAGVKLPEKTEHNDAFLNQHKVLQKVLEFFKSSFKSNSEALNYCNNRGITSDLVDMFSIGYAPKYGDLLLNYLKKSQFSIDEILNSGVFVKKDNRIICRFRDRVMFPVFDRKGSPIAFGGRGIQKDAIPKYINSPETAIFQKRETLYGYNLAIKNITKDSQFIVVEGYMDVVMMHKFGFNTAVASMGTAFSVDHLIKIWKYSNEPIICLDGDSAGYNAMVKVAILAMKYLQPGKSLRFCSIPNDNDPDSFLKSHNKSEMNKLILDSDYLIDFVWKYFLKVFEGIKKKTPEKIAEWKKEIYESIENIQNIDIKSLYKNDIKNRIFETLNKNNKKTQTKKPLEYFSFSVDKKEKNFLREAALLYILIMRRSIVSAVVEELATIEFLNCEFENLRNCIVDEFEGIDFNRLEFVEVIASIKQMVSKYYDCENMDDEEVTDLWHSVFDFGISKKQIAKDLKIAKDECNSALNESTWDRLRALKLDFLDKKNKK